MSDPISVYEKQLAVLQVELDEAQLREDARYADYLAHGRGRGRRRAWRVAVRDRKRIQNRMRQIYNKIPPTTRALMGDTEEPSESIVEDISSGVATVFASMAGGGGGRSTSPGGGAGYTGEVTPEEETDMLPLILAGGAVLLLVVSMRRK